MPFFLLKHFVLVDLKAMVFGVEEDDDENHQRSPSFLVRRGSSEEDSGKLPIQRKGTMLQISQDIASDRAAVKATLARAATQSDEEAKVVLARTYTLKSGGTNTDAVAKPVNAYSAATEAARSHHMARRGSLRDFPGLGNEAAAKTKEKPAKGTTKSAEGGDQALGRRSSAIGA